MPGRAVDRRPGAVLSEHGAARGAREDRAGDLKLIYFHGDGVADGRGPDPRVELYDLSVDLGEAHDLSRAMPEPAIALRDRLVRWLHEVGANSPIVKSTGRAVALPAPGNPLDR